MEVDIDGALSRCEKDPDEDVVWIDQFLKSAVKNRKGGQMRWDFLVRRLFQSEKLGETSVVKCVNYLLSTAEKLALGEEAVEERKEATTYCCRDLAAAYMRGATTVDKDVLTQRLGAALSSEDYPTAYQHQTDMTLSLVMNGSRSEVTSSLMEELKLSLKLGNLEGALHKIIFYHLYRDGLEVITKMVETTDVTNFDILFSAQKQVYDSMLSYMDEGGGEEEDVAADRSSATVVVSKEGVRGRVDGQFRVQDLESALRLVRQGGTIFLEAGDYASDSFWDVRQLAEGEGRDVSLIGASTATCSIRGSIRVEAARKVSFKRLKLEVGQDAESAEAVHIVRGELHLDSCLVEAVSNTAFYVSGEGASLYLKLSVLDGLESCQRLVHLAGKKTSFNMEHCYASDMFSLVTSSNQEVQDDVTVRVHASCLSDLQECVRLCLSQSQGVQVCISASQASMVLYDAECGTSSTLEVAGLSGQVEMLNCNINFSHCDGRALVARWGNIEGLVRVARSECRATGEVDRKLAVSEAVVVQGGSDLQMETVLVDGFRLGVRLEGVNRGRMEDLRINCCSVGIYFPQHPNISSSSLLLDSSSVKTTYYGVMGEQKKAQLSVANTKFIDVPKAFLVCQGMADKLQEENCSFLLSREYTDDPNLLEAEMNLHLATQENLPHRLAYSHEDLIILERFASMDL